MQVSNEKLLCDAKSRHVNCKVLQHQLSYSIYMIRFLEMRRPGGSMVQCWAGELRIASSILAHGRFLVRGVALSR